MKRSEMLELITNTIKAVRTCEDDYSDENIAKHILYTIENVGMLPPHNENNFELNREVNEWEEEI